MELVNIESESTISVIDTKDDIDIYRPVIMWNLMIDSYLSEKDTSYRAYGCNVKVKGKRGEVQSFRVYIKDAGQICDCGSNPWAAYFELSF